VTTSHKSIARKKISYRDGDGEVASIQQSSKAAGR